MGLWKRQITVSDDTVTSAVHLTLKQSLIPNFLVTILFFLWGFAYGLLDVLNPHFQKSLDITPSMASGLSAAYFGAYFLCPPTISGWILRRFGFRVTFMCGLAVLAVGCLLMWPSGVKASFGGYCGSMFVVGTGLSTLETAADPFLAICGPPRYSEIRLNLAQAVQAVGSFVAPLLASRVFFASTVDTAQGLKNVQWVYLGVACFVGLLIILFFLAPMPEITDADMGTQEMEIADYDPGPLKKQYNLFLAVWSQFCYVGAQVAVANYFVNFCEEAGKTAAKSSDIFAAAQGLYAFNRFLAGGLMTIKSVKPRYVLATYLAMCFVFVLAASQSQGDASIAMLCLVLCWESACFATIFTLGLRGLGRHTKIGGSLIVAAISGGAVFPPMTGAVATHLQKKNSTKPFHMAMLIPMAGFICAWIYPIYVNVVNKELMDTHRETDVGIAPRVEKEYDLGQVDSNAGKGEGHVNAIERA
ncbi:major facilitator superfamily domain-containing protein [Amylocarpus encephaloides]|uniref:Major facilitator superfamily domain-containing protein n=1 Tax=Amylocarpus encephaloides TaxID=45428 RepID=A0A9P7YE97_9HELO|nr:major facilitator superfamily domain-containing protein [Amylocarpus encephaloides]